MSTAPSSFLRDLADSAKTAIFDLEADDFLEGASEIHCMAFSRGCGGSVSVSRDIETICQEMADAEYLVGHNIIKYDVPVLEKLGYRPRQHGAKMVDTLLLSQLIYPNLYQLDEIAKKIPKELWGLHKLQAWGYRLGLLKDDYQGGFESWNQEMQDYNVQDVEVTKAFLNKLADTDVPDNVVSLEMDVAEEIGHMERTGVCFNERKALSLYCKLEEIRNDRALELQKTFPPIPRELIGVYGNQRNRALRLLSKKGIFLSEEEDVEINSHREWLEAQGIKFRWTKEIRFNPSSTKQIASRMEPLGWVPTKLTPTGLPQIDEPVILEMAEEFPQVAPLTDYLMVMKRMGQIVNPKTGNGWLDRLSADGRIHGQANTLGCITSRFAHSKPNLGQVPSCDKPYGAECRDCFEATEGWTLLGVDADGLELRTLAHYLYPWDGGAYAKTVDEGRKENGTDVHTMNQKAAGLPTRAKAKTFIYALLYGAGDEKLGTIILPKGTPKGKLVAGGKKIRGKFMRAIPAMAMLTKAVKQKAAKQKKLIGLDGRTLVVRSAHSALNLLLQSAGAILVKKATVIFCRSMESAGLVRGEDWRLVLHVHDEWQTEVRNQHVELASSIARESIEQAGRELGLNIRTTGEAKVGPSWASTH